MESPTRVLIVDDSAFFRNLVSRSLRDCDGIQVAGVAVSGANAIKRLATEPFDVVILDVVMPEMDGLETLKAITQHFPHIRVLMLSGHTGRSSENTVAALLLGAEDFILKPTSGASAEENLARLQTELSQRILGEGGRRRRVSASRVESAGRPVPPPPAASPQQRRVDYEAMAIGASTGGPRALRSVLQPLVDLTCPIFITQHMPRGFTSSLAEQLSAQTGLLVQEAEDGESVVPARVYLAPGGLHMEVTWAGTGRVIRLSDSPPVNYCRPSVDVLFRSVAASYAGRCLGLVLTGMGSDGLEGARDLVAAGGEVLTQDRESCTVWGMPRAVTEAGLATPIELARLPEVISAKLRACI